MGSLTPRDLDNREFEYQRIYTTESLTPKDLDNGEFDSQGSTVDNREFDSQGSRQQRV